MNKLLSHFWQSCGSWSGERQTSKIHMWKLGSSGSRYPIEPVLKGQRRCQATHYGRMEYLWHCVPELPGMW